MDEFNKRLLWIGLFAVVGLLAAVAFINTPGATPVLAVAILILGIGGFLLLSRRKDQSPPEGGAPVAPSPGKKITEQPLVVFLFKTGFLLLGVVLGYHLIFSQTVPWIAQVIGISESSAQFLGYLILIPLIGVAVSFFVSFTGTFFGVKDASGKGIAKALSMVLVIVLFSMAFTSLTGKKPGEIPEWFKDWGQGVRGLGAPLFSSRTSETEPNQAPVFEVTVNTDEERETVEVGPGKNFNILATKPFILYGKADADGSRGSEFDYPAGWESFVGAERSGKLVVRGLHDNTVIKFFPK